jgi:hypothetical protein
MSVLSKLQSLNINLCSDLSQIDCCIFHPTSSAASRAASARTQESVLRRLQSVSVKPCSDPSQIDCSIFNPTSGSPPAPPALVTQTNPLVSCLMVTRGNIALMRYSLACYQRQTYANRELVVVAEPEAGEKVRAFIALQESLNVTVFVAPAGLTLGDHRNLAAARARGAILVTWDDDDLSDPRRLDTAVQVLRQTGAAAAFLARLLVWWPQRKVAAISSRRLWEQSIAAWRSYQPIYASLPSSEDTVAINRLISTHHVAQVDCPFLYVYAVTGLNVSNAPHFEGVLSTAECIFEGDQFDELNEHLSDRLPVLDYAALLKDEGAVKILG